MSIRTAPRVLVIALLSLAAPAAFAQDDEESGDGKKVQYKAKTEIDFEGLDVSGELVKPAGSVVAETKRAAFNPAPHRLRTRDGRVRGRDQVVCAHSAAASPRPVFAKGTTHG
jgi:hypothetical protein